MNKKIFKNIFKVSIISIIIVIVYKIGIIFINANDNSKNVEKTNKSNFKVISSSDISKSGVAISTNIGIKYNQKKVITQAIYQEYFTIEELKKEKSNVENAIIARHMIETKEYYSLLKTDFKTMLQNSNDRKKTLEGIYGQLRIRYNNAVESIKTLEAQKKVLVEEFDKINNLIEATKTKISEDFRKTDTKAVNQDIDQILKLRQDYYYLRTYIVFINNFLAYYNVLNNYNLNLINVFSSNKDAIEKGSYVVLPASGNEILKEYGLLYTEDEYKNKLKADEANQ
ncbi:hypothetical protein BKN14_00630 [Candidatus Gracilibacteria bacterium HOT-871]|nr:hypothetical protein BKN14_00630 [Candidatus Gracilibacteria bacterium HOT-871]RKW24564.1 MAG: hypothetical protein D8B46_01175 [Candidatus Gracilibacteria bacterium]